MTFPKTVKYTISVHPPTWERVARLRKRGDSMDTVINRAIDALEKSGGES
jgi:hypothetical protein